MTATPVPTDRSSPAETATTTTAVELTVAMQTDKRPADYAEIGRRVEELGFDGLTAFADLGYQPPLPALLAAASATARIRLGVACWNPTMLHPVELAGQFAALVDAAPGRTYLGLTRGSWLDRIGIDTNGGVRRLAESIEVIRLLLSGNDSGFVGDYYRIDPGFRFRFPIAEPDSSLLLGVWGPRGAALAARYADEVKLGGCANPAMIGQMRRWLTDAAEPGAKAGRPVGVVAGAVTVVDTDRRAARSRARTEVAMYLDVVAPLDRTANVPADLLAALRGRLATGDHDGAGRLIPDDVLDLFSFAGTPDDIAAQVAGLAAAGATRIEFGTPHGLTDLGGINLLGTAVLPAVRDAVSTIGAGA